MKTAITGGIGSGKSYVCQMLRRRGIDVYDCDSAARRLMQTSPALIEQISQLIGPEAYDAGHRLNKACVARFLLASADNARRLDDIVHPAVAADFVQSRLDWMECALLYQSRFDQLVDRVVAVVAPVETRIDRIVCRDSITPEAARQWIDRQMPQEEVAARAHIVIVNDGLADLETQIDNLINNNS